MWRGAVPRAVAVVAAVAGGRRGCCSSSHASVPSSEDPIDRYVSELLRDQQLLQLPLGLGTTAPPAWERGLYKAVVQQAVALIESTLTGWNAPGAQSSLVGHPIRFHLQPGAQGLTHRRIGPPFELLEPVARLLAEDGRVAPRVLPGPLERQLLVNLLHVMGNLAVDMLMSSTGSMHGGALHMDWRLDPAKQLQFYQRLADRARLAEVVKLALDRINFDVVEREAKLAVAEGGSGMPGELASYRMGFTVLLLVFFFCNLDAECAAVGQGIRMELCKPETIKATTEPIVTPSL